MEGRHVILRRLLRRDICGGKHLPEVLALSWIKHMNKMDRNQAVNDYDFALKTGVILRFRHTGEWHVSVAAHKNEEIGALLEEP